MATTIKLTSKRQATFPAEVCDDLGVQPGDELELQPRVEKGERLWVLRKLPEPARPWLGALKKYRSRKGKEIDHSMAAVRENIRKGRTRKGK